MALLAVTQLETKCGVFLFWCAEITEGKLSSLGNQKVERVSVDRNTLGSSGEECVKEKQHEPTSSDRHEMPAAAIRHRF